MYIPLTRAAAVDGVLLVRHFGIPLARYMEGSVVKRQRYGLTTYHALKRVMRNK